MQTGSALVRRSRPEPEKKHHHCMLVHAYYPIGEVRVECESQALLRRGYQVDIICLRQEEEKATDDVNGARVFRLPVRRRPQIGPLAQFLEYLRFLVLAFVKLCQLSRFEKYVTIQVHMRIPVKPATQSGESGHPVGAKRRWGFHDVSGGRFESM